MSSKHASAWRLLHIVMVGFICVSVIAAESNAPKEKKAETAEKKNEDIWKEVSFESEEDQQLTEKQVQKILDQLKKSDPQRASQLEKLKNTDTEKFIASIRDEIQKQQKPPKKPAQDKWKEQLHKKHEIFLAWFEKQCPEDHKELIGLQQSDPEKFVQRVMDLMKIYEPIQRMERYNPKLAAAMKQNLELQKQRDALLLQIRIAPKNQQEKLIEELSSVVEQRFDTIILEKQLRYEWLEKRLDRLRKEVELRAEELETLTLNTYKKMSIQDRVNELIERTEKVNWD